MKILVCGGRDFGDKAKLYEMLDFFNDSFWFGEVLAVVVGGARGADTLAREWAEDNGIRVYEMKAQWDKFGKAAGRIRNEAMLDEHPDIDFVVAFPTGGPGTNHMMELARSRGYKVMDALQPQPGWAKNNQSQGEKMKVLVCGGRDYYDAQHLFGELDKYHAKTPISTLVEGGSSGAETLARYWAKQNKVQVVTVKADYSSHGTAAFGMRDEQLFTEHSDLDFVLCFPTEAKGSTILMDKAKERGYEGRDMVTDFKVG